MSTYLVHMAVIAIICKALSFSEPTPEIREIIPENISPVTISVVENTEVDVQELNADTEFQDSDIYILAHLAIAEAEGESEYGKRLVICTVLNRVDSSYFPDTIEDVIFQENQFSCITDGRWERCSASDDICELVREELQNRTNYDVVFFNTGNYSKYGKPLFKEGNHYFGKHK